MYSLLFLHRSKPLPDLLRPRGIVVRLMGGGPRTFPGGLNKWQWKRMHEKKAREKEKRLLEQEKQIYQARVRSQIRSSLVSQTDLQANSDKSSSYEPMSPTEHIKALADRFVKAGAEDLWNEKDGPLFKTPREPLGSTSSRNRRLGSISSPVDLRSLISDGSKTAQSGERSSNFTKTRDFSMHAFRESSVSAKPKQRKFRRNESSSSDEDDLDYGFFNDPEKIVKKPLASKGYMRSNRTGEVLQNVKNDEDDRDYRFFNDQEKRVKKEEGLKDSQIAKDYNRRNHGFSDRKGKRFWRNDSDDDDDDDDEDDEEEEGVRRGAKSVSEIESRAALGKYDVKFTRRVPLKDMEDRTDIEWIRQDLEKKKSLIANEGELDEKIEESILSEKRFEECGISPLTVKALTEAGYVQMTRVQETTLSVCFEGKDALVKAKTGTGKSAAFLQF